MGKKNQRMIKKKRRIQPASDQTESHVSAPQEITTEVVALKAGDSKPEAQKLLPDQTESLVSAPQEMTTEVVALKAGDSKPEAQKLLPDQTESLVSAPQEMTTEVVALKAGDSKPEAQKLLPDQTESLVSAPQEMTEVEALKAGDSKPEAQKLLPDQTESHVSAPQEMTTEDKNPHVYPLGDSDTVVTDIDSHVDSEIDNIPKLKRTKSIVMDVIPDFTKALFDSSEDSASAIPGPSTSLSNRPRRKPYKHTRAIDLSSDESSGASDQEYIPNPREESTDSDASMESESKRKKQIRQTHSKRPFKKTQQKGRKRKCLKGNLESTQKPTDGRQDVSTDSDKEFMSPREQSTDSDARMENKSNRKKKRIKRTYSKRTNVEANLEGTQKPTSDRQNASEHVTSTLEEQPSIFVNPVLKKQDGSRSYNKKHYCFYCGQLVQKMSRHLIRRHNDKIDVIKATSFPKNSKERRIQLDYIRNKGNFQHNKEVMEISQGKLIPWKQPKNKAKGEEFAHCVYCYGLFTKRVMWRHFQVCNFKPKDSSKPGKTRVQALCAFAEPAPPGFPDAYWKFLSEMNQDNVAVAVKKDHYLLLYGNRLFHKNRKVVSQHQYIRQKLRELGRFLLESNKISPVKTIKDLIKPEKYGQVVTAARSLAGFNDETGQFQHPSLARKVGHSLHSFAMFVKSEGLKSRDKQAVQDAEQFAQLYQESWRFDIASQALTQLDQAKWNSPQLLPFTEDVQHLHCYLSEKQQHQLSALNQESSPINWKDLAKVTLAQIILFNRRRAGEVSRMPLSAYLSKDLSDNCKDTNLALTTLEQKLCKHFVRITIAGKRGRKVAVLLTPLMRESLDVLTKKREDCGVLSENGYLFALPHSFHYLRGSDCIRQFVNECSGLKNPTALTSTKLRKHIATMSTVLNLKTTELDQLADFLGHNIEVHRKHYRLPEGTLQLAKISKVLLALEQGRLGEYKGKSLDEIHLDVNEIIELEGTPQQEMEDQEIDPMEIQVPEHENAPECTSTKEGSNHTDQARPFGKKERQTTVKRPWTTEECAAVEKHLKKYIVLNQVPGKLDCELCISAEPESLKNRDWKAVKYYVKNRITSVKRKCDSRCFLFSVFPTMRVYTATAYNEHFMYLNQHQQTMPNGLGMGGQHEYFGLWLDSDFGRGHSRARPKCTTYGSPQLSGDEDFTLDSMEVWHVGKPPKPEEDEEEEGKKSILFVDPEVQALMEMTGKTLHSEGLREPEDD